MTLRYLLRLKTEMLEVRAHKTASSFILLRRRN